MIRIPYWAIYCETKCSLFNLPFETNVYWLWLCLLIIFNNIEVRFLMALIQWCNYFLFSVGRGPAKNKGTEGPHVPGPECERSCPTADRESEGVEECLVTAITKILWPDFLSSFAYSIGSGNVKWGHNDGFLFASSVHCPRYSKTRWSDQRVRFPQISLVGLLSSRLFLIKLS